jgi:hypothetical protein
MVSWKPDIGGGGGGGGVGRGSHSVRIQARAVLCHDG